MANTLYLLIGGNQGDRIALLHKATDLIQTRIGSVAHLSPVYETAPWGLFAPGETPQNFLNLALEVLTPLPPIKALHEALAIEKDLGRQRPYGTTGSFYSSRPIDIDLILYDDLVIDTPELVLPHPRMHLRQFVLKPLCDIAPDYIHPIFNKTIRQLLEQCPDTSSCACYA